MLLDVRKVRLQKGRLYLTSIGSGKFLSLHHLLKETKTSNDGPVSHF